MRIAALVLGIIGGIIGLFAGGAALAIGGLGSAAGAEGAGTVVGGGMGALLLSVLGIVGGALAMAKPRLGGALMLVAAIGGFIAVSLAYLVAGPLLLVGGLLGVFAKRTTTIATSSPVTVTPTATATPARTSASTSATDASHE